jgi:hypothetical protein
MKNYLRTQKSAIWWKNERDMKELNAIADKKPSET